ncbi:hypothetical protein H8959_003459 [Pygathrix nigripes]
MWVPNTLINESVDVGKSPNTPYVYIWYRVAVLCVVGLLLPLVFLTVVDIMGSHLAPDSGERVSFKITLPLCYPVFLIVVHDTLPATAISAPLRAVCFVACMAVLTLLPKRELHQHNLQRSGFSYRLRSPHTPSQCHLQPPGWLLKCAQDKAQTLPTAPTALPGRPTCTLAALAVPSSVPLLRHNDEHVCSQACFKHSQKIQLSSAPPDSGSSR